jgi:quercetin dioxygenase-like cupin family protein
MDIPSIERQIRRDAGAGAEPTPFGSVHWVEREGDPPGAEMTIGVAVFDGGKSNVEHVHPNCEEAVYVLAGSVDHTLGGQRTTLYAGDLIIVPRGVPHQLINTSGASARCYIVFSSPDRQFEPTSRE